MSVIRDTDGKTTILWNDLWKLVQISPFRLDTGDCLTFEPEGTTGKIIAFPQKPSATTGKKYSHAAIVREPGVIIEAAEHGVVVADPADWVSLKHPIAVWSWPERLSEAQKALVREYLDAHLGDPYPYWHLAEILYFIVTGQRRRARIKSRFSVCSALCTRALRHAGLDAVPGCDESVETPTDITEGKLVLRGYLDVRQAVHYASCYRPERTQMERRIAELLAA